MKYKIRYLVILPLLLLGSIKAFGQNATLQGTVTDANTGEALPGANVYIQELNRGTATNADGEYQFTNVPVGGYLLQVTFVGYNRSSENIQVQSGTNTVDIKLEASSLELDDIVVTALGVKREQRSIGYAVQEVDGEDLARARETNMVSALAGKMAGVQISSSSGQPGAASRIVIRGNTSFLGNNQPLFVVDGIPISNAEDDNAGGPTVFQGGTTNRALDIDPSIIKDVTVLKGASATALYGSRASAGAVIITTKGGSGVSGTRINVGSRVGWSDAIIDGFQDTYLQGQNGYYLNGLPLNRGGYVEPGAVNNQGTPLTNPQTTLSWGPAKDNLSQQVLDDLGGVPTYNPRKDFYRSGFSFDKNLSIAGGAESLNYFLSAGNLDQQSIIPNSKLNRTSLMAKFGGKLGEDLTVQSSVNYIRTKNYWLSEGNGSRTYLYGLNFTPISFDISDYQYEDGTQRNFATGFNNPLWLTQNNGYTSFVDRFIASTEATYNVTDWISIAERIGIDTYVDARKEQVNIGTVSRPNGSMYDQKINRTEVNSDFTINFDRNINRDIGFNGLVGNNINTRFYKNDFLRGENLNIPGFYNISNASVVTGDETREDVRLVSLYGQATLDYQDFVYLTLTARNDWSSTLPKDNNSYFYPSASLGFVFTDAFTEVFRNTFLDYGKVRASLSQIGSDAPAYSLSTNYVQANPGDGQRGNINFPFNGFNGYQLTNVLGNPDLKPEISTEYEFGLELRMLQNRARVDFAYYNRSTKDQIFSVPVSPGTGYSSRLVNAGELKNYGVELTLAGSPIETQNFRWDMQLNYTRNTSEVVKLSEGVDNIFLAGFTSPQIRILPEKNGYGVIWGTRYDRTDKDRYPNLPEGQLLIDDNGYPILASDLGSIGQVQPDWTANLRTTFRYRGLSLSALFDMVQGGDILNFDLFYTLYYGTAQITENRGDSYVWEGVNANTGQPNTTAVTRDGDYYRGFFRQSYENYVEDGSYLKLRELSLSYSLPVRLLAKTPLRSAEITATGRNLWINTDFSYGDPEGSLFGSGNGQGFYHMVTPSTRSYSLSLRLGL